MSDTRIYKVTEKVADVTIVRLVSAANSAQAIRHVVKGSIACEVCSVADAIAHGALGTKVEIATGEA